MTSKERILCALECKTPDYVPCSFMLFFNLSDRVSSHEEYIMEQVKMGLDPVVSVGKLTHSLHPEAQYKQWTQTQDGNTYFYRRIDTPKGPLTQKLIQSLGWPDEKDFHEDYNLFSDFSPPRMKEMLVKPEEDLEKLKYLFGPFSAENIESLKDQAKANKKLADKHNLIQITGIMGWGDATYGWAQYQITGADMLAWLSGFTEPMILSLTNPEIIREYLNIIHQWNMEQIKIYLEYTDVDVLVRRGWYESTEFWTPGSYRDLIAPLIKKEADYVHQAGKKYGYIITSAFLPLVDMILDTGIDVLIGLDPEQGKNTDMAVVKSKFTKKGTALWGGVSGPISVENGTEEDTERAVIEALRLLSPGNGFILSPVDNVSNVTENVWRNTYRFVNTWKANRSKYIR